MPKFGKAVVSFARSPITPHGHQKYLKIKNAKSSSESEEGTTVNLFQNDICGEALALFLLRGVATKKYCVALLDFCAHWWKSIWDGCPKIKTRWLEAADGRTSDGNARPSFALCVPRPLHKWPHLKPLRVNHTRNRVAPDDHRPSFSGYRLYRCRHSFFGTTYIKDGLFVSGRAA